MVIVLERSTAYGRRLFALGANPRAAELALVRPLRMWVATFAISGAFAGITGLLFLGFTGKASGTVGEPLLFQTIAAVVIGGTSLIGGLGGYARTALGAIVLILLSTLLLARGVESSLIQAALGVLIIVLVSVYGRRRAARHGIRVSKLMEHRRTAATMKAVRRDLHTSGPVSRRDRTARDSTSRLRCGVGHHRDRQEVRGIENPSYLCISPDGRNLHAVWEVVELAGGPGQLVRHRPGPAESSRYQGVQGSRGTVTCYAMMDSAVAGGVHRQLLVRQGGHVPDPAGRSLAEASASTSTKAAVRMPLARRGRTRTASWSRRMTASPSARTLAPT